MDYFPRQNYKKICISKSFLHTILDFCTMLQIKKGLRQILPKSFFFSIIFLWRFYFQLLGMDS